MGELQVIDALDGARKQDNAAVVYVSSLAPGSRRTMRQALDVVAQLIAVDELATADAIPWHRVRYEHMATIRAELADRYNYRTANKILSAVRGTLKAAWRMGQMSAEDYQTAVSVSGVDGSSLPAGRAIAGGELAALLDTCGADAVGTRDAAIIALLYACGLRRAELVALDVADYDAAAGELRVLGKRNKERLAYVGAAAAHLADWLQVRGQDPGALFVGAGNRNRGRRLTTQAIYNMLQRRAAAAGVPDVSPHDFRRSFVSDLLDRGADLATVKELAGHKDIATTARYDRRGERAKRKAVELLHVPHTPRQAPQGETSSATPAQNEP